MFADPSQEPAQLASFEVELAANVAGSLMVTEEVAVHPFASVTVSVYDPAHRLLMVAVVAPLLQAYVYGAVPTLTVVFADPSQEPAQLASFEVALAVNVAGSLMVTEEVAVHPFASVTVSVYDPAHRLLMFAVVAPLLQA